MINSRNFAGAAFGGVVFLGFIFNLIFGAILLLALLGGYILFYDGHEKFRTFLLFVLSSGLCFTVFDFVVMHMGSTISYKDTPLLNIFLLSLSLIVVFFAQMRIFSKKWLACSIPVGITLLVFIFLNSANFYHMTYPNEGRSKLYAKQKAADEKLRKRQEGYDLSN